jgi:hypothetical protein
MSKLYKTARGKTVDMDKIKLTHETVLAVGNMKVNARGDQIGPNGQIMTKRNQIMDKVYGFDSGVGGVNTTSQRATPVVDPVVVDQATELFETPDEFKPLPTATNPSKK